MRENDICYAGFIYVHNTFVLFKRQTVTFSWTLSPSLQQTNATKNKEILLFPTEPASTAITAI